MPSNMKGYVITMLILTRNQSVYKGREGSGRGGAGEGQESCKEGHRKGKIRVSALKYKHLIQIELILPRGD